MPVPLSAIPKEKWIVLSCHVALSLLMFLASYGYVHYFWFSGNIIELDNGWYAVSILAWTTILIGPILSWLFTDFGRACFKHNFIFVLIVQLLVLVITLVSLHEQRTAALVYFQKSFYSLSQKQLDGAKKQLGAQGYQVAQYSSATHRAIPVLYLQYTPPQKADDHLPAYPLRPDLFQPIAPNWQAVSQHKITDKALIQKIISAALMQGIPVLDNDLAIFPIIGRAKQGYILFNASRQSVISINFIRTDPR